MAEKRTPKGLGTSQQCVLMVSIARGRLVAQHFQCPIVNLVPCDFDGNVHVGASCCLNKAKRKFDEIASSSDETNANLLHSNCYPTTYVSTCYMCYGQLEYGNPNYFLKDTADGEAKLSSEWMNVRKKYWGRRDRVESRIMSYLHKKHRSATNDPDQIATLDEIYRIVNHAASSDPDRGS